MTDKERLDKLKEAASYSVTSSGFNNALSKLCSLGFAQRHGSMIRLNPEIVGL